MGAPNRSQAKPANAGTNQPLSMNLAGGKLIESNVYSTFIPEGYECTMFNKLKNPDLKSHSHDI